MTNTTTFTPSASVTISPPALVAATLNLPAVDGSNPDLKIDATAAFAGVWLSFSATAGIGRGEIFVPAGQTFLLTFNPATLAAAAANPLVTTGGAATGAASTTVSAVTTQAGGSVVISRGLAVARSTF